jgi:tetratricopeptide (TPR) repeat protein
MVQPSEPRGAEEGLPARYSLLEMVRQDARRRLAEAGEGEAAGAEARLCAWCVSLAEEGVGDAGGAGQTAWLARLAAEWDNLRGALGVTLREGPLLELGLRLVLALWPFWEVRGHWTEGRAWVARARSAGAGAPPATRATLYNRAGTLALFQADYDQAETLYQQSLALRRDLGDRPGVAALLNNLGIIARHRGDYALARRLHEESCAMRREMSDRAGLAGALNNLGILATTLDDLAGAAACFREAAALWDDLGDALNVAYAVLNLGTALRRGGDLDGALACYEECLSLCRERGEPWGIAAALNNQALIARLRGDYVRAAALGRESLPLWHDLGDRACVAESLEGWAELAGYQGQHGRAATLLAAACALRTAIGAQLPPAERTNQEQLLAALRAALDEAAFEDAWRAGQDLSVAQAVAYACAVPGAAAG